jgi:hypothetical protein
MRQDELNFEYDFTKAGVDFAGSGALVTVAEITEKLGEEIACLDDGDFQILIVDAAHRTDDNYLLIDLGPPEDSEQDQ